MTDPHAQPEPFGAPHSGAAPADPSVEAFAPQGAPRTSRRPLIIGAAVGLVVLGGAGAWAYTTLGGGGAQPEDALPGSVAAYLRLDLDPSASQKVDLLRLAGKVPALAEALGVEFDENSDLREVIFDAIAQQDGCEIDYAKDIEPWLGKRAGFAALPVDGGAEPSAVFAVEVSDENAARAALEGGFGCGEGVAAENLAFNAGYAIVTDESVAAADVVDQAKSATLADNKTYQGDLKSLGDPGLVSFWLDVEGLSGLLETGELDLAMGAAPEQSLEGINSMIGALRTDGNALELVTHVGADDEVLKQAGTTGSLVTADLPDTTLAAVGAVVAPDSATNLWEQLDTLAAASGGVVPDGGALDQLVDELGATYDIHLPEDLATLLGEQLVVAVDGAGLDDLMFVYGPEDVNVALRTVGDTDALTDLANRLSAIVEDTGAGTLATAAADDGMVFATNDSYAQSVAGGGDLGSTDAYRSVVDTDKASGVFFLNLDALATVLEGNQVDAEVLDVIEPLRAVGMTTSASDSHAAVSFRLSFD